ncbi:MAG: tetratricopeptide repeat protein [Bacteroidetes bacterium]|nr:tetratricopeptide repeat protein [Bacteroidota bacterium]
MKKIILLSIIIGFISCNSKNGKTTTEIQEQVVDNPELIEIYKIDQADRKTENIDWNIVTKKDRLREVRIYELLDSNKVRTSLDYHNAAMIFQHGRDSIAFGMAVKFMRKSIELDSTANKWLLAAAIDRDLLSRNKPQIYGTQYWKIKNQPWELRKIDTTKISDVERIEYGVETLAQQREKEKRLNSKKINELLNEGKTIDELIHFIKTENVKESKYDLSESGLNNFGYQLISQGNEKEASKIFKLNTELYPNGFNTFDSYGECLLKLGDKANAIKAYRKSLNLNPDNKNAEKILTEME